MTLPLIYALNNASWLNKRHIINIIKNESEKPKKVAEVIKFVRNSGGISYTETKMKAIVAQAFEILDTFPQTSYKDALRNLVQYTIERTK